MQSIKTMLSNPNASLIGAVVTAVIAGVGGFVTGGASWAAGLALLGAAIGIVGTDALKRNYAPSFGNSSRTNINSPEEAPLKKPIDAQAATKLLDDMQRKFTAEEARKIFMPDAPSNITSADAAIAATSADQIYSNIKVAEDNAKQYAKYNQEIDKEKLPVNKFPESPLIKNREQFEQKYKQLIVTGLSKEGLSPSDADKIDFAKLIENTGKEIDAQIIAKRKSIKLGYTFDAPRIPAAILAPVIGYPAIGSHLAVKTATESFDTNAMQKFNETVTTLRNDHKDANFLWKKSNQLLVAEQTRDAIKEVIELDDLLKLREGYFNDREKITELAAREYQNSAQYSAQIVKIKELEAKVKNANPSVGSASTKTAHSASDSSNGPGYTPPPTKLVDAKKSAAVNPGI